MRRREFLHTGVIAATGALAGRAAWGQTANAPLYVGSEPVLLLDDWCIELSRGLERVLHQPKKHGLIQEADGSDWQRGDVYHGKIVCRDNSGKYHMTYRYHWWDPELEKVPEIGIDKAHWQRESIGYATSEDGIHWHKPTLGLLEAPSAFRRQDTFPFEIPLHMSRENNLGCPFDFACDLHAHGNITDPAKRFLLRYVRRGDTNQFAPALESQMYFAADWPDFANDPGWRDKLTAVAGGNLSPRGFRLLAGLDHGAGEWFVVGQDVISNWLPRGGRDIARYTSPDLREWQGPQLVLPVAEDEPREPTDWVEYMDMQAYRVGGVASGFWLGQLIVFHSDRSRPQFEVPTIPGVWRKGLTEVRLTISRDAGKSWQRVCDRQVWLPHHEADDGYDRLVFSSVPLRVGNELRFYYSCFDGDHLVFNRDGTTFYPHRTRVGRTALATLRADGYVSLDAGEKSGELVTRPLRVGGRELVVNADAARGELRLEVQDEEGRAIEGFQLDECLPVRLNSVAQLILWRSQRDVRGLEGRVVRLRFVMQDASLYSFQFRA